jgi:tRNA threonylcarbamoyl adenosine modification protein YeaZ
MTQLIIDTSSEDSLVALLLDGEIIASCTRRHANQLSRTLMPDIQSLLLEKGITLTEITSIAVGIGPGSYTGTRVGVAVARALSYARSLPLVNFCSLLAFLPAQLGSFACVMPSRTGDFFLLKGTASKKCFTIDTAQLVSLSALTASLENIDTLVAKPLEEMKRTLPLPWTTPTATFDSIANFLTLSTPTPSSNDTPETDLIYLHSP